MSNEKKRIKLEQTSFSPEIDKDWPRETHLDLFVAIEKLIAALECAVPSKYNTSIGYPLKTKAVPCSHELGHVVEILNKQSIVLSPCQNIKYNLFGHSHNSGINFKNGVQPCLELIVLGCDFTSAITNIKHNMVNLYRLIYDNIVGEDIIVEQFPTLHFYTLKPHWKLFVSVNKDNFENAALMMRFIFAWFGCWLGKNDSITCTE